MSGAWDRAVPTTCRFGYEEHDGARYCFEHGDFLEAGAFYSGSRRCKLTASIDRPEGDVVDA